MTDKDLDKGVSELILKENPGRWALGPLERCKQGGPRLFLLTPAFTAQWMGGTAHLSSRDS